MQRWHQLLIRQAKGGADEANIVINEGIGTGTRTRRPVDTGRERLADPNGMACRSQLAGKTQHQS